MSSGNSDNFRFDARILEAIDSLFPPGRVVESIKNPEAVLWFARRLYKSGRLSGARQLFKHAYRLETMYRSRPDLAAQALIGLGLVEVRLDCLDDAENTFSSALEVGAPGASRNFEESLAKLITLAGLRRRVRQSAEISED